MIVVLESPKFSTERIESISDKIRELFPDCETITLIPREGALIIEFPNIERQIESFLAGVVSKCKEKWRDVKLKRAVLKESLEWV